MTFNRTKRTRAIEHLAIFVFKYLSELYINCCHRSSINNSCCPPAYVLQADGIAPKDTVQHEPSKVEDVAESSGSLAARKRAFIVRMEQEFFCCLMTCAHRTSFDRLKNWNLASARVTVLKEGESRRSDASWYSWVGSLT